jgi:hypothetical protein
MHGLIGDSWDPNTWAESTEYRIYADDAAQVWAVVDEVDYWWAIQWKWALKPSRGNRKHYLYRTGRTNGIRCSWYLHVEIHRRREILPPSPLHTIVDHRNGNSFCCNRSNLRWATPVMNRRNLFGQFPHDLLEG